ncbi:outer membrane lipoprotein-sorting protein [Magnetococcus sp. PR-3]|uniref:outer membrane lipoprotein-sorting protein n=1 Tax=Magnetococcus sp. PR-3 TaxID=3120355 RepID=UPI002FCE2DE9
MKTWTHTTILTFLALLTLWVMPVEAGETHTGRQIMDLKAQLNDKDVEFSVTTMTLIDRSGKEKARTMHRFARKFEDGLSKYLLVFKAPKGVKGVASLSWEKQSGEDDQWTFLPALGKLKRVVGGGKRSYFMGTDFANEDLVSENRNNFRYERQPDTPFNGRDSYVVDAYPAAKNTKKSTGYSYRRLTIDKETLLEMQVQFFARRSKKLVKTLTVQEAINVEGVWRPKLSLMDNLKEQHQTRSLVESWSFSGDAVDPKIFNHRYLKRKKHMR